MRWEQCRINTSTGNVQGISPIIISASRSTDIPAFYSDWFINRLRKGYSKWINPFNRTELYISFSKVKLIVFWSKNPKPLMKYLSEIEKRDIKYYFQFTLNDYESERLEPKVPPLIERIETFKELSSSIGKDKVIWRFDPLILTDKLNVNQLLERIENIGDQIHEYTKKLVYSYADISNYAKVKRNLKNADVISREFTEETMFEAAEKISELNKKWNLEVATCGEVISLERFGINHNKCIDDQLIEKIFPNDLEIKKFLGMSDQRQMELFPEKITKKKNLKDKGQRAECSCIYSKDIGQYNTCSHLCTYCYANHSTKVVN